MQPLTRVGLALLGLAVAAGVAAAPEQAERPELEARLAQAELLAGLTAVEGPGLTVTLRHSPRIVPHADRQNLVVRERDVNGILNALRAAGAEALAISGSASEPTRLLVSTAVVDGRAGLMVGGRTLLPPYRILAIGDARSLRGELFRADGVVKQAGLEELQMIEVQDEAALSLPAARAGPAFRYARGDGGHSAAIAGIVRRVPGARHEVAASHTLSPAPPAPVYSRPAASVPSQSAVSAGPAPVSSTVLQAPETKSASHSTAAGPSIAGSPTLATPRAVPVVSRAPADSSAPAEVGVAGLPRPEGLLFGGKGLARYHLAGCRYGERIPLAERVFFKTPAEADRDGRAPCPICAPGNSDSRKQTKAQPEPARAKG